MRTNEINKINNIKDTKLKSTRAIKSINNLSLELAEFSSRIDVDLPVFSENFREFANSYSKILLAFSGNESSEVKEVKNQMFFFRDHIETALESSVVLLQTVSNFPLLNAKFNQSKRQTELSVKNITKEFLEGLMLLDEALENQAV